MKAPSIPTYTGTYQVRTKYVKYVQEERETLPIYNSSSGSGSSGGMLIQIRGLRGDVGN